MRWKPLIASITRWKRPTKKKKHTTRDVGGTAGTVEFTDAIIANLESVAVATGN